MTSSREILERLVGFPTVSAETNLPLIAWADQYLRDLGFVCHRLMDDTGTKAGLLARIGPGGDGGVLLSSHSDVVPVVGQDWTRSPFNMTAHDGRYYGRGSTDMKGFLSSALWAAKLASEETLSRPLMLSISYDEEIGCVGIRRMIDEVVPRLGMPDFCIVGEPTSMNIAIGHKGKAAYRAKCRGQAGHSAMAPRFVNALHLAADTIQVLRAEQSRLLRHGAQDTAYEVPTSTVHAGRMAGGLALNIVPDFATVDFEIRHLAEDSADAIINRITTELDRIAATAGEPASISIEQVNAYPGLETPWEAAVVQLVTELLDEPRVIKVAYGTEAGFFARKGIPTVVCGPGSMDQAHKADEYIEASELAQCDAMMRRLVARLKG